VKPKATGSGVSIEELEALRTPLTRYCYRLLGSAADTEDAVQETMIRASGRAETYDPARARLTTWVHRIATNVCIDMLRGARRRALSIDLGTAGHGDPGPYGLGPLLPADYWVEPMPDARLFGAQDPAEVVVERETVTLAFIAALQRLAPRQRAALVLRDILAFTAQETAEVLDTSVPAVNSALQRARAVLKSSPPEPTDLAAPEDPQQQDLLRRYVAAFETHDVAALTALLREDAVDLMPPFLWRVDGAARIGEIMSAGDACAEDRLVATSVNASPAFGQYRPGDDGVLRPFALVLVEPRGARIARIVTFLGTAERFAEFGLPAHPDEVPPQR
jgi:RNA polymerase sigma-70 factor (TIGR02960 family)